MSTYRFLVGVSFFIALCVPKSSRATVSWTESCAQHVEKALNGAEGPEATLTACLMAVSEDPNVENLTALGFAYYMRGNHASALKYFERAAQQNFAWAQNQLGIMHLNGQAVSQSDAEAVRWFRKAAEQNLAIAQDNLGRMYLSGRDPQNDTEAVRWFRRAAEQGYANAQVNLGAAYEFGLGVRQDDAAALSWYRRAAESGHPEAQNNLGLMYANGRGVPPSEAEARMWWTKAAEQGHVVAQINLGDSYLEHDDKDYETAARWYQAAAAQEPRAQAILGYLYAIGKGVPRDKSKAKWLLEQAAANGTEDVATEAREGLRRLEREGDGSALWAILGAGAIAAAILASLADDESASADTSSQPSVPPCGRDWRISPARTPCGDRWAALGGWPSGLWCYTDYNMQIGGDSGVTYCTNGISTWPRTGLFDSCNGKQGWCDE